MKGASAPRCSANCANARTNPDACDAAEIIARLELKPHPEGGTIARRFAIRVDANGRSSTAIYFLLARGERSHWHRIDASRSGIISGRALTCRSLMTAAQRQARPDLAPAKAAGSCRRTPGKRPKHRRLDAGRMHGRPDSNLRFELRRSKTGRAGCTDRFQPCPLPRSSRRRQSALPRSRSCRWPGKARQNQKRGREQRRRVGCRAQHADVAALHADIPGVECGPDRTDAERRDGKPLRRSSPARPWPRPAHARARRAARSPGKSPPPHRSAPI